MDAKEQKLIEARDEASRKWAAADLNCEEASREMAEAYRKRGKAYREMVETNRKLRKYRDSKAHQGAKVGK